MNRHNNSASGSGDSYFICGTIGELSIDGIARGHCTFELIPDEEMKTLRNGREGICGSRVKMM